MITSSLGAVIALAILYGATMKIADLLDEHGLHWFRGDKLLFGLLWGIFGILLVASRADIANVILAMVLAYLIRMRLDYFNHVLASTMIIASFLFFAHFDRKIFTIFFLTFVIFGGIRDYVGNVRQKNDWLFKVIEPAWYYVIPPAIYALITDNWTIFIVLTAYRLAYNIVKYSLEPEP